MHPVLFHVPGLNFPLRTFGLMVALGFLLGTWIYGRLVERYAAPPSPGRSTGTSAAEAWAALPVWVLIGVVLGARLLYVVVEIARDSDTGNGYLEDPLSILFIWKGGLVMYGGLFGAMFAGWLCCRRHGLAKGDAFDLGLTSGFFGQAVGRIGCLMVGDDYGSIVPERFRDLPFPITIRVPEVLPVESLFGEENAGQVLWATQIWMSANALLLGLLGLWLLRRRKVPGTVALWLVFLYSLARIAIEAFRGDSIRGVWLDGAASTSQLIGVVSAVVALVWLLRLRGRARAPAAA